MNKSLKMIIFGFAFMFLGGIVFLTNAIFKDPPAFLFWLSFGLFIGFIIILIGLITYKNNK